MMRFGYYKILLIFEENQLGRTKLAPIHNGNKNQKSDGLTVLKVATVSSSLSMLPLTEKRAHPTSGSTILPETTPLVPV